MNKENRTILHYEGCTYIFADSSYFNRAVDDIPLDSSLFRFADIVYKDNGEVVKERSVGHHLATRTMERFGLSITTWCNLDNEDKYTFVELLNRIS